MQRALSEVDIDGRRVHTGETVQVNWLGVWYEGTVIKIGPKRNLCRIRDDRCKETVLLESKYLQPRETRATDKRICVGDQVVYKDGDSWLQGVVEARSAVGVIMASWRKSGLSQENCTWFEQSHIAPVIQNHLYQEHNRELLEAGKSGLLHNDAIEPRPRTMQNLLYESDSEEEADILTKLASSKSTHTNDHRQRPPKDMEDKEKTSEKRPAESAPIPTPAVPLPAYPLPSAPVFLPLHPTMPHPYGNMFLPLDQNHYMKLSSSFTSAPGTHNYKRSALPHPRALKRPGLAQTSVPCIMSYSRSTNGIPPHPSSRFFQSIKDAGLGKRRLLRCRAKPGVGGAGGAKKSPVESRANSEPSHYATVEEVNKTQNKVSKPEDPLTLKEKKSSDELLSPHHAHSLPSKSQPLHTAPDSTMKAKYDLSIPPPLPPRPFQTSVSPPTSSAATTNHTFTDEKSTLLSRKARPSATAGESRNAATQQEVVSSSKGENKLDEVQADDAIGETLRRPTLITVPHGGSTLLTCVARSPHSVQYQWLKDDKPISENDPFFTQPAPGMLQIQMASLNLTGEYRCEAYDGHNTFERVFHLEVYPDKVGSESKDDKNEQEGTNSPDQDQDPPRYDTAAVVDNSRVLQPPIIIVEGPESETSTPPKLHSPPPVPTSSGRDTPDVSESGKTREKAKENRATEQEVDEGRKRDKRNRRRASSTLKNDMEQYLEGYGENYGALSSQTDKLHPWMEQDPSEEEEARDQKRQKKQKKKMRKAKKAKGSSHGSSSPTKSASSQNDRGSPKYTRKTTGTSKLPSALLRKQGKKEQVSKAMETKLEAVNEITPNPSKGHPSKVPPTTAERDEEETNSVAVHTSLGASSGSEVSLGGADRERLRLPQEQETLNDSIRRLQLSVEEHCPEQLRLTEKDRKMGFLSNIFPRKRSS